MTKVIAMQPAFCCHGYNGQGKHNNPTRRPKATPSTRDAVRTTPIESPAELKDAK